MIMKRRITELMDQLEQFKNEYSEVREAVKGVLLVNGEHRFFKKLDEAILIGKELQSLIDEFEDENESLQERVNYLEQLGAMDQLPSHLNNLRLKMALDTIIQNIEYIDIAELEAIGNKTPMLPTF